MMLVGYALIVAISLLPASLQREVYVSPLGKDEVTCGKSLTISPCLSIGYAVKHVTKDDDTIYLDNTEKQQTSGLITYVESASVIVSNNLTIDVVNHEVDAAKVLVKTDRHPALFYMHCRYYCTVNIRNIDIQSPFTGFYLSTTFHGKIAVTNSAIHCRVSIFGKTMRSGINAEVIFNKTKSKGFNIVGNVLVKAYSSVFDAENIFLNVDPISGRDFISVSFHDSILKNGTFMSNCALSRYSTFNFENCTLNAFRILLREINNLFVQKSTFENNQKTLTGSTQHYLSFIQVYKAALVNIQDSNFINSTFGAVSVSYCTNVTINSSQFKENIKLVEDAQGGGALLSFFSGVSIKDSTFFNNTAIREGGTIHLIGGNLHLTNILINTPASVYNLVIFCQSKGVLENVTIVANDFVNDKRTILTLLPFNVDFINMGTWEMKSNVSVYCAENQKIDMISERTPFSNSTNKFTDITTTCTPCPKGSYSFQKGFQHLWFADHNRKNKSRQQTSFEDVYQNNVTCSKCASEASCDSGTIKSKGNSWGYRQNDEVKFIQCPAFYCCSPYGERCISYDTCAKNREGTLCGKCMEGFSEDIFSAKCLSNQICSQKSVLFWIVYILGAIIFTYFLMYFKDVFILLKMYLRPRKYRSLAMEEPLMGPNANAGNVLNEVENDIEDEEVSDEDENDSQDLLIPSQDNENHHAYNPLTGQDDIAVNSKNTGKNNKNTISGIFKILVQFYQVESMLRVDSPFKTSLSVSMNTFMDFIISLFNIKIISDNDANSFTVCPIERMTALGKEFIMSSIPLTCLVILLISYIINQILNKQKPERQPKQNQILTKPFTTRIKVCILQLFLTGYVTISLYLLKLVHCIEINGINVVYVQGDTKCYQSWQYLAISIIVCWVVPFSVSLYFSSQMLMDAVLTPNEFLATLFIPAYIIVKKIQMRRNKNVNKSYVDSLLHKQERDNLVTVLTGPFRNTYKLGHPLVFWESIMILRRLILCLIYVYVNNVVIKLYLTLAILILCLVHHGFI
eukprot:TCONS_00060054-protein